MARRCPDGGSAAPPGTFGLVELGRANTSCSITSGADADKVAGVVEREGWRRVLDDVAWDMLADLAGRHEDVQTPIAAISHAYLWAWKSLMRGL